MSRSTLVALVVAGVTSVAGVAVAAGGVFAPPPVAPTVSVLADGEGAATPPGEQPATPAGEHSEVAEDEPDVRAPDLTILSPRDGDRFDESAVRVRGWTEPGAHVEVGGRTADVGADGAWSVVVRLAPGANELVATATDAADNASRAAVVVFHEAQEPEPEPEPTHEPAPEPKPEPTHEPKPEPEPEPEPAPAPGFTAHQEHELVEHDPPYNYYRGTGTPGAKVKVWSEYGSAYAKVDAKGNWETKVWFEHAPYGTHTWRVIAIHGDHERAFEFTGVRPEKPHQAELTAHQQHELVEGDPPANVYWGTATPGGEVKVWSDYGHVWTDVREDGTWEVELRFASAPYGTHTWRVKVFHGDQVRAFEMTGVRPGQTDVPEKDVAFTAQQKFGSSSDEIPYDVFWGTARPGSLVRIESAYGHATVEAGPEGHWEAKVAFPEAPRGETFEVHVMSKATGEVTVFTFTATHADPT